MKRIIVHGCLLFSLSAFSQEEPAAKDSFYTLSPVEVKAVRVGEKAPFTKTNISKKEISKFNLGQDIPFLLNQTPAVVVNSDAGNGIGYTGLRIRGTDATRINVTINGIPYNDAESQGTFFVDLPDFLSSTASIQVIRGVGSSSNGAGAFGASINISTNEVIKEPYAEINNSTGSFNTLKNTLRFGTGVRKGFSTDVRVSRIISDGFIDRASSSLTSIYLSTAYTLNKSSLRLNVFSGKEKTYQAWYGISEADLLSGKRRINYAGMEKPGTPYDNETDNYKQSHYQLFFNQVIDKKFTFNTGIFLTKGKGYYEQYKADQDYSDYHLPYPILGPDTVFISDLVRQLWLDNDFYGNIFSLQYKTKKTALTLGGSASIYDGLHFGKLPWAANGLPVIKNWYGHDAIKKDFTVYLKQQTNLSEELLVYYDLQYRNVIYKINGFRNNPAIQLKNHFNFFNPKLGISFSKAGWKTFLSFATANKEPNRDDFEAGIHQQPEPERLNDLELGIERTKGKTRWAATAYLMDYKNQLVLTGQLNDVGAYARINIPDSYRTGLELEGSTRFTSWFQASANVAFSKSSIRKFTEYIDDYDNGGQISKGYNSTAIAFSPQVVAGNSLVFLPWKKIEISLVGKYVSRQYLDNTENRHRSLDPFMTQDIILAHTFRFKKIKEGSIALRINNIFGENYEPNGYTFSYFSGNNIVTENYYYPMAGRNFMVGLNLRF